ncbi:Uncharacterised protein [Mycobacteroides abscessus subsp. massiliense]|uniref:hypothetical protein n=1 Tax=Mycobacteroides abscessus TaxID=36809 RepID=UPI0009C81F44|nr:hypothetical protein [Mycobacteroides abscessus]SKT54315.1 Uncharacterised protein [Mycobacteroides abscessus subsp. massiliense]
MRIDLDELWATVKGAVEEELAVGGDAGSIVARFRELLREERHVVIELPAARESGSWTFFGSRKTAAGSLGCRVDLHDTWLTPAEAREQAASLLAAALHAEAAELGWVKITCAEREQIWADRDANRNLAPISTCTDIGVEFHSEPEVFTEWGDRDTQVPVLRDYRYPARYYASDPPGTVKPDRKPCEHYRYGARP